MGPKGGRWRGLGSCLRGRRGIPGERMGNEGRWTSLQGQAPLITSQASTQSLSRSPSGAVAGMSLLLQQSDGEQGLRAKAVWTRGPAGEATGGSWPRRAGTTCSLRRVSGSQGRGLCSLARTAAHLSRSTPVSGRLLPGRPEHKCHSPVQQHLRADLPCDAPLNRDTITRKLRSQFITGVLGLKLTASPMCHFYFY